MDWEANNWFSTNVIQCLKWFDNIRESQRIIPGFIYMEWFYVLIKANDNYLHLKALEHGLLVEKTKFYVPGVASL
jgi:hypothetical protein